MRKREELDLWISLLLALYDRLETGDTVEQINLDFDIQAAGGGWMAKGRDHIRQGLELVRRFRDDKLGDRNDLLGNLNEIVERCANRPDGETPNQ